MFNTIHHTLSFRESLSCLHSQSMNRDNESSEYVYLHISSSLSIPERREEIGFLGLISASDGFYHYSSAQNFFRALSSHTFACLANAPHANKKE